MPGLESRPGRGDGPGSRHGPDDPPGTGVALTADFATSATELRRAWPLLVPGVVAVIAGGLIAAGVAHAPTSATVWMAAYLVLVVGVAQLALAIGQALLAPPVGIARIRLESLLFNIGSVGVIAGTVGDGFVMVVLGTALFVSALGAFLPAVRGTTGGSAVHAYRILITFVSISALVGLVLSASGV